MLLVLLSVSISILSAQPIIPPIIPSDLRVLYMVDKYAVEVLLNKPDISYNINALTSQANVAKLSYYPWGHTAFAYRSHYDNRLVVIISEQPFILIPHRPSNKREFNLAISIRNTTFKEIADKVKNALNKINWKIDIKEQENFLVIIFMKNINNALIEVVLHVAPASYAKNTVDMRFKIIAIGVKDSNTAEIAKNEILNLINLLLKESNLRLTIKSFIKANMLIAPSYQEEHETEGNYLAVRIQIPLKEEIYHLTYYVANTIIQRNYLKLNNSTISKLAKMGWHTQIKMNANFVFLLLRKQVANETLYLYGKGVGKVMLIFVVNGSKLNEEIINEFKKIAKLIGVNEKMISREFFKKHEEEVINVKPLFNITESEIKKTLETELKWLVNIGVIKGLTESDIKSIVSVIKLGNSGWNYRLVWYNGKWVPYISCENAVIPKGPISCPPRECLRKFIDEIKSLQVTPQKETVQQNVLRAYNIVIIPIILATLVSAIAYYVIKKIFLSS